jgi:hypothetical protein
MRLERGLSRVQGTADAKVGESVTWSLSGVSCEMGGIWARLRPSLCLVLPFSFFFFFFSPE